MQQSHTPETPEPQGSTQAQRDRELFNDIADHYTRKDLSPASRTARQRRLRSTLLAIPGLPPRPRILEVGCAGGFSARYLEGMYSEFVGIDHAEGLIEYACRHNALPGVSFVATDVQDYAPDQPFDVVLMIGVLHHFEDLQDKLRHMRAMIRPGGYLVANEPQATNVIINLARRIRARIDSTYSSEQTFFAPADLAREYEDAGYGEVRITPQGIFSTPFAEVVMPLPWLMKPLVSLAVLSERLLEKMLGRFALPLTWNIIASGKAGQE